MGIRFKASSITLLAILTLSLCIQSIYPAYAQIDQTTSKLQAANTAVEQAFNAVSAAEKAGANVTDLLSQLNYANIVLARAENSYRAGDFTKAAIQADSVLPISQKITITAQEAQQTALVSNQDAFWFTMALTIIGVFVFVSVLFLVWLFFKRNYIKNLSKAKPEVVGQ